MVPSRRTCQAQLLRMFSSCGKFSFLDRFFRRPLLVSVLSPLISDVSTICGLCNGPCVSLSSSSFSSVNINTSIVHKTRKLLNQIEARNTNCSSRRTAVVLSPPQTRGDTWKSSDHQWKESQ